MARRFCVWLPGGIIGGGGCWCRKSTRGLPGITGVSAIPMMMTGIIIKTMAAASVAGLQFPSGPSITAGRYDMKSSRFADRSSDWIMPAGWLASVNRGAAG